MNRRVLLTLALLLPTLALAQVKINRSQEKITPLRYQSFGTDHILSSRALRTPKSTSREIAIKIATKVTALGRSAIDIAR